MEAKEFNLYDITKIHYMDELKFIHIDSDNEYIPISFDINQSAKTAGFDGKGSAIYYNVDEYLLTDFSKSGVRFVGTEQECKDEIIRRLNSKFKGIFDFTFDEKSLNYNKYTFTNSPIKCNEISFYYNDEYGEGILYFPKK